MLTMTQLTEIVRNNSDSHPLLTDPSSDLLEDVIDEIGNGAIGREWLDSVHRAIWTWMSGTVESCPYGPNGKRLSISWRWESGSVYVAVSRV